MKGRATLRHALPTLLAAALLLAACSRTGAPVPPPPPTGQPAAGQPAPAPIPPPQPPPPPPAPKVTLAEAIQTHAFSPDDIERISRFRSLIGHDYSDDSEKDRSLKHYLVPLPSLVDADNLVKVYSPVDGTIVRMFEERPRPRGGSRPSGPEPSGWQVQIAVRGNDAIVVILFHVNSLPGIAEQGEVKAGQQIGFADTRGNSFDIAVRSDNRLVSYFEILPDALFADYRRRGLATRADLVLSQEHRDRHPLDWNSPEAQHEGWVNLH